MSAHIRFATTADLDDAARFLARHMDGDHAPAHFRGVLSTPWSQRDDRIGVMVEDEGRMVGFLGAVYADRVLGRKEVRTCNMTSWFVLPEYRSFSVAQLKTLIAEPDTVYTNFSASPVAQKVIGIFKFQQLDTGKVLFLPNPLGLRAGDATILTRPDDIAPRLNDAQRRLMRDHRPFGCGHVWVERGDALCYAITLRRSRGAVAMADVLYTSDAEAALELRGALHRAALKLHKTPLLAVDARRALGQTRISAHFHRPTFFYTKLRVKPAQIDTLYSELVAIYG